MTEKRFEVVKFTELEYGIRKDNECLIGLSFDRITAEYIVKEWNALTNENEELKSALSDIDWNYEQSMENEIETSNENILLLKDVKQLKKENEHIRQTIKTLYETERTQIGKNVLKQLYEAIQ